MCTRVWSIVIIIRTWILLRLWFYVFEFYPMYMSSLLLHLHLWLLSLFSFKAPMLSSLCFSEHRTWNHLLWADLLNYCYLNVESSDPILQKSTESHAPKWTGIIVKRIWEKVFSLPLLCSVLNLLLGKYECFLY